MSSMNTSQEALDQKQSCIPCSTMDESFKLDVGIVEERLRHDPSLELWEVVNLHGGAGKDNDNDRSDMTTEEQNLPALSRSFVARDFQSALDAINAMAVISERESHHPNFHLTNYRDVRIDIYTHKLSGITNNDLALAAMLSNEVKIIYSPKWLRAHPEALATARKDDDAVVG